MQFKRFNIENDTHVELTSMTDIVFLLLIFFMLSSTFVDLGRHLNIQLPETSSAEAVQEIQRHVVEMGLENRLQLDGRPVSLPELVQQLTATDTTVPQRRAVVIRADRRLPYGEVITVLGLVRQANINDVAVAVR